QGRQGRKVDDAVLQAEPDQLQQTDRQREALAGGNLQEIQSAQRWGQPERKTRKEIGRPLRRGLYTFAPQRTKRLADGCSLHHLPAFISAGLQSLEKEDAQNEKSYRFRAYCSTLIRAAPSAAKVMRSASGGV